MTKEQIKKHFQDHKEAYAVGAVGIVIAGFTYVIMREKHANLQSGLDEGLITEKSVVNEPIMRSLNILSNNSGNNTSTKIVSVLEREGRGHPGYLVRCLETGDILSSQQQAANKFGIPESVLSDHLRGRFPDANGLHFERISLNEAA